MPKGGRAASLIWSPDGHSIALLHDGEGGCGDGCFDLYAVNADGSGLRNLTRKLAGGYVGHGAASAPAWSPDGRRIVFVRLNRNRGLYTINVDGSGLRKLTGTPGYDGDAYWATPAPVWSPDGRKIAFAASHDGDSEVYVMNANGTGRRNLTRSAGFDGDPHWSPDGRRLLFVSNRDGDHSVYVMNADGSGQQRLPQSGG